MEYCDIYDMSYEVDGRECKEVRRKSGECDVIETKEKGSQCWMLRKAQVKWSLKVGKQKLFVTLPWGL